VASSFLTPLAAAVAAASVLALAGQAMACDGAGVIIRIDGRPQDVQITRAAAVVSRPRVLEVVCRADQIRALGETSIVLSIDGSGTVTVGRGGAYTVPNRGGAPSVAGNVYRSIDEQVMPDMKRMPWNVRLKGAGDDFGFALPTLVAGGQKLTAGSRPLLVRLVGGTAPYKVVVKDAAGAVIVSQASDNHEVALPAVALAPGAYHITASDSTPRSLEADINVVADAPPMPGDLDGASDPEVKVATASTLLARDHPGDWSFEAEQRLAAAPDTGLDRDKVYELIESYGSD
jgi:hypothetical protein